MALLLGIALGVAAALASGSSLSSLENVRLRGEPLVLLALGVQIAAPLIMRFNYQSETATVVVAWLLPSLLLALVCALNVAEPGIGLCLAGLLANLAVVAINGGMPVGEWATSVLGSASEVGRQLEDSWLHVPVEATTRLVFLGDLLPLPGPRGFRGAASVGDILLATGSGYFVFRKLREGLLSRKDCVHNQQA